MQLSLQAQLPDTDYRWMAQGCAGLGSLQWQLENLDEAYRSLDVAQHAQTALARGGPVRPTRRSRSPPACPGLPSWPERRVLAAGRMDTEEGLQRRSGACAQSGRSPLPSAIQAASQYYELQTKAAQEDDDAEEEDAEDAEGERCSIISEHAAALNSMACVLQQLGHEREALVPLSRSVAMYEEVLGPDHSFVGVGLHNVGLVHWGLGEHEAAQASLEKACRVCEFSLGACDALELAAPATPLKRPTTHSPLP